MVTAHDLHSVELRGALGLLLEHCCSERSRKQLLPLSKKELSHVKKLAPKRITSSPVAHADVALIGELDEQWSFVGSKARQHGL
ncbi:IS1 family transposase [Pectobacterium aquaticum]|uniref:IS1 family transposase n=1 Tax=Pectobacterium aquaticum TaxID=2204145 RepID=UPI003B8A909B